MIDLHLHFDGSLLPRSILELAKEQGIKLPTEEIEELKGLLTAPKDCQSLNEYLEKFDLPLLVLQTKEGIEKAMYTLVKSLQEQGLLYAEIRFAPQLHMQKGMKQTDVVKAAVQGLQKALAGSFMKGNLILCCMRGNENLKENLETIRTAASYLGRGVAAVDLAGAEAIFPTKDFKELFDLAKELEVPYTIHAGEADGPESMYAALSFGTKRLGHGVRAKEDSELLEKIRKEGITLEVCPISNEQTKAVPSLKEHPILEYLRMGIKVTVNTDNMTVSDTTIEKEFQVLEEELGLTKEEKKQLLYNSVDAAFLSQEEKGRMKDVISKII